MRSIFQMGLSRRDQFIGQALPTDAAAIQAGLNAAMKQYDAVAAFAARPNYRQLLGASATSFDYMKGEIDPIYADVIESQGYLNSGASTISLTDTQGQNIQDFIKITQALYAIIQRVPAAALPAAGAAAAASNNTLLIGGGIAAALVVAALALKG